MEAQPPGQKPPGRRRSRASISPPAGGTPAVTASCSRYPLRRGSSFTFLTPGPHWDFTLKRKRREKDDDAVSLSSLDFKISIIQGVLSDINPKKGESECQYYIDKLEYWENWEKPLSNTHQALQCSSSNLLSNQEL